LVRGAAGDFKVGCTLRCYPGDEQQPIDPLIASVETIDSTPAYRGLALAVFEDLQLGDFGNRIPFFTFEVEADPQAPTMAAILGDASEGEIAASDQGTVVGYAAYGDATEPAVQPIVAQFGIQLFDDGHTLRAPASTSMECTEAELGCSADLQLQPKAEVSQTAARFLPTSLTIEYYDAARDYQSAQARASIPGRVVNVTSQQLPVVLDAGSARAFAETALARQWAERDTLRLRLPPRFLMLEPGMLLRRPQDSALWVVSKTETDGMAVIADLHSQYGTFDTVAADPGRVLSAPDVPVEPTSVAILELPDVDGTAENAPLVTVAASNAAATWKAVPIEIQSAGAIQMGQTAALPSILGTAETILTDGQSALIDERNRIDVQLLNPEQWLESCDDDALVNGINLTKLGDELIQFGTVLPLGGGRFRLSRLLRGRRGTEWAMDLHELGETFVLLDPLRLQRLSLGISAVGSEVTVVPLGLADSDVAPVAHVVSGEALKPPSPAHLVANVDSSGNLNCSWCRRSRLGWAWIDDVDAPLDCSSELYRVQLQGAASSIELETDVAAATFPAGDIAALGSGLILSVTQIGDLGASRPASIQIDS
jgi:hypothetical protein